MNENTVKETRKIAPFTGSFKDFAEEEQAVLKTFALVAKKTFETESKEGSSMRFRAMALMIFLSAGTDALSMSDNVEEEEVSDIPLVKLSSDIEDFIHSAMEDREFDYKNGPIEDLRTIYNHINAIIEKEES